MADNPNNDPRLEGYIPLDFYRYTDMDRSSRRIRDMPFGRRKENAVVSPSEMNFGTVGENGLSAPQIATITNTGYDTLEIRRISAVGDFTIATDAPSHLAPGESASVAVNFNPRRQGIITGGLYIDTGDAAGTEFVKLRGTGELGGVDPGPGPDPDPDPTGGVASLSASALAFGDIQVGTPSAGRSVTLRNTGSARLAIASIAAPTGFTQTNNCGTGLAAGASCTITTQFSPSAIGARTGNLSINHDGTGPKTVGLSGTGVQATTLPVITVSDGVLENRASGTPSFKLPSATLSLGTVDFGETAEGRFIVEGSTEGEITLTTLPAAGFGFTFGYSASPTGPFLAQTTFTIPTGGALYVRARAAGPAGNYARQATFGSVSQSGTIGLSAVIREEVIIPPEPTGLKRIRIAGNQFYEAQSETDQGGVLPASGGIMLKSVNWFGAEGANFTPHGTWTTGRRWTDILDQIKGLGFNCVRLPFSNQLARTNPLVSDNVLDADMNGDLREKRALDIFDMIIDYANEIGLYIVLDCHRREAGNGADGGPIEGSTTKAMWHQAWDTMANRYKDRINVVGADLHNEPHNLDWATWASLSEELGNRIHGIAPNWVIFVEGVGHEGSDHYWWAGHLKGVKTRPVVLQRPHRVAYSPHEYGQSVGSQVWLAYDNQPAPAGWPTNLPAIWNDYWGFIFYENIAPIWIGEMGGHFGLNIESGILDKPHRVPETAWMTNLVRYMMFDRNVDGSLGGQETPTGGRKGMSFAWWSWNPNSGDTGGLVRGDWTTVQQPKINLIQPLLNS